jgi:hypothetical protein
MILGSGASSYALFGDWYDWYLKAHPGFIDVALDFHLGIIATAC